MDWEEFKITCKKIENRREIIKKIVKNDFLINRNDSFSIDMKDFQSVFSSFILEKNKTLGIDRKMDKKLKNGELFIDDEIDLHWMSLEKAHKTFINFIANAFDNNYRCLLVITGKGLGSKTNDTIKNNLPEWFKNPYFNDKIVKYTDAHAKHGGNGAVYVLLKRNN